MPGLATAIRKNLAALDRLSVTITDIERAELDTGASAVGLSFPQFIRTREEDDAWERLRQLGLEPEKYCEE